MTGLLAFAAALAVSSSAPAPKPTASPLPRCFVKVNQPAASVRFNRTNIPANICVSSCDAAMVGVHREEGQTVGLAIYTGRHCGEPEKPRAKANAKTKKP